MRLALACLAASPTLVSGASAQVWSGTWGWAPPGSR